MRQGTDLFVGDLVQLDPERVRSKCFAGCFMVVTEVKGWGAVGYITPVGTAIDEKPAGQCYYRAAWPEMACCGRAAWVVE